MSAHSFQCAGLDPAIEAGRPTGPTPGSSAVDVARRGRIEGPRAIGPRRSAESYARRYHAARHHAHDDAGNRVMDEATLRFKLRDLASDLRGAGRAAKCARPRSAIVEVERLRRDSDEVQPSDPDAVLRSRVMARSTP